MWACLPGCWLKIAPNPPEFLSPGWELFRSDEQAGACSSGLVRGPRCSPQHLQHCRLTTKTSLWAGPYIQSPACSVIWLLRESGPGASTASPSARSDLAQPSILIPVLEAEASLYSSQVTVKSGHTVPLQNWATATIHNAIPALHGKWFRTIMSNDEYICSACGSTLCSHSGLNSSKRTLSRQTNRRSSWSHSVRTWLLACYRCAHCLLRKNGKMA